MDLTWHTCSFFVKVFRPGDSKGVFSVFESGCHLLASQLSWWALVHHGSYERRSKIL